MDNGCRGGNTNVGARYIQRTWVCRARGFWLSPTRTGYLHSCLMRTTLSSNVLLTANLFAHIPLLSRYVPGRPLPSDLVCIPAHTCTGHPFDPVSRLSFNTNTLKHLTYPSPFPWNEQAASQHGRDVKCLPFELTPFTFLKHVSDLGRASENSPDGVLTVHMPDTKLRFVCLSQHPLQSV